MSIAQELVEIADRLRRLRPSHRDPEEYFVEKSELEHQLRRIVRRVTSQERPQ